LAQAVLAQRVVRSGGGAPRASHVAACRDESSDGQALGPGGQSWRGVNLGGWLVLEKWMAPDLFEAAAPAAVDERSLLLRGGEQARTLVTRFRDTFVTEDDFRWLKQVGRVTAVRLPLGFWCLEEHAEGTPFLPTSTYVDNVFKWAAAWGIRVLLDLHGASGSQNSEHHSGLHGAVPHWLEAGHRATNLEVLEAWAKRWGQLDAFLGLGLGNEVSAPKSCGAMSRLIGKLWPSSWRCCWDCWPCCTCSGGVCKWERGGWSAVADFYTEAATLCRPHLRVGAPLVVDTCWDMERWTEGRLLRAMQGPVWLDYHHYQCMGSEEPGDVTEHCEADVLHERLSCDLPGSLQVIVGEFSIALKPEAEGYDGEEWQRRFFDRQRLIASENAAGWFFWSYKMQRDGWPHWSYRESVERGWIDPAAFEGHPKDVGGGAFVQPPPALVRPPLAPINHCDASAPQKGRARLEAVQQKARFL